MWGTNKRPEEPRSPHTAQSFCLSQQAAEDESIMMYGLSLRVSWICLLLFSGAACFPASKGDYKYPYTWSSGGGSAPGSNSQSEGSRPPLVNLQYAPSASNQQPEASSSTGNQSPSSVAAPSVAAASSPSYEPNRFIVTYNSSSNKPASAPQVPSQGVGYVSPTRLPPPTDTGKKTPSFSAQPQSAAGTSGNFNMGSGGAASGPVYGASPVYSAGGYMDFGDGPVPYIGAPAAFSSGNEGAGPSAYDNTYTAAGGAASGPVYSAGFGGPVSFFGASSASSSAGSYPYAAPVPYDSGDDGDSVSGLPWSMESAGGAGASFSDPSNWMPSRDFPDFSVWDSNAEMPQSMSVSETSPLPPSSYIIQSRNGYQRAREFLSHTKYSPEYPEPPVFAAEPVKAPRQSPPETGSKGGKKV